MAGMTADQVAIIARLKANNAQLNLRPELRGEQLKSLSLRVIYNEMQYWDILFCILQHCDRTCMACVFYLDLTSCSHRPEDGAFYGCQIKASALFGM